MRVRVRVRVRVRLALEKLEADEAVRGCAARERPGALAWGPGLAVADLRRLLGEWPPLGQAEQRAGGAGRYGAMGRAWLTLSHGLSRPGAPSGSDGSAGRGRTPSKSERSERAPAGALSNASAEQPGRIAEACTSAMSLAARADAYLRCQAGVEAARAQVGLAVQ